MSDTETGYAEYLIGLAGDDRDVRFVAGLCQDQPFWILRHDAHGYLLKAPTVMRCRQPIEASQMAPQLLNAVNGLARCQDFNFRPLHKDGLHRLDGKGAITPIPQIKHIDLRAPQVRARPYQDLEALVTYALTDPKAARVLKLLAYDADRWFALWWVYELVLEDLAESRSEREKVAQKLGWASDADIRAFRATANWHEVEGSRHAVAQKPQQERPTVLMHELHAHRFISRLVLHWLRARV
jgi:hypothetical protein